MFEQSSEILEKELISVGSEMNAQFVGSESRDQAQSSFVKLYELKLREKEIESEKDSKKKERRMGIIKNSIEVAVPALIFTGLTILGFNFEETGSLSSPTFKNVIKYMKPSK